MIPHLLLELRLSLNNVSLLVTPCVSALIMFLMLRFGLPASEAFSAFTPAFMLTIIVITILYTSQDVFTGDHQAGRMHHWLAGQLSTEWCVICKWLCLTVTAAFPMTIFFVTVIAASQPASPVLNLSVIALCCAVSAASCGILAASITVSFSQHALFGTILSLPFLCSVVIFGASALTIYTNNAAFTYLLVASLLINPFALWASARILRQYE